MKWKLEEVVSYPHNYVELSEEKILRKGEISAREGEAVVIPVNMRDGLLLGIGRGNCEWNYSAPHGAGRIVKRKEVKNYFTVSDFKKQMEGVYSTCIGKDTLDEAPFAYRSLGEIRDAIEDTVSLREIITPVYNYKSGGD